MAFEKGLNYNSPNQTPSTIDKGGNSSQMNTFFYLKKAIIEARKEQFFIPLASSVDMPKHMGKTIKVYAYIPLLDDRNKNDQGIDANGTVIADGNLYGSNKDIGLITSKLPMLTENGGRVNRVGFTRIVREGSIYQLGFFYEFTEEALNFDSDAELQSHLARELLNGATEIVEDILQKDLIAAAGVTVFPGAATATTEVTGEGADPDVINYESLMRADQILTDNRCPKNTKVITGSRLIDTKTLPSCRVAYVGSEVVPLLKGMKDLFDNKAFIEVQHYADAGNVLNGEIGSIDNIRFVQVPEMLHMSGHGATAAANPGYRVSGGKYDVFPVIIVGDDSFSTIGFQTDGSKLNFDIITKNPGHDRADRNDPYGLTGFSSIRFYYGFLCKRPERILVLWTVAPV